MWELKPLYKTTLTGKESVWQIGFSNNRLWIKHGLTSSKDLQIKTREVKENNSKRTLEEQALLEAKSRYNKMLFKGYSPEKGKKVICRPMLANVYEEKKIKSFPVAVQPKLDGIRALCSLSSGKVNILSRTGKDWVQLSLIREELKELLSNLPENTVVDGEIFSETLSFEELSGLMRTSKGIRKNEEQLKYFCFDLITDQPFEERYTLLHKAFKPFTYLQLVPTYLARTHEEIIQAERDWVNQGCEGCMIRRVSFAEKRELTLYKPERNNNLLKCKSFQSIEVTILDVEEGKGTEENLAIFVVKDDKDNIFNVRPEGTFAQRKEWFDKPQDIIGKRYTIDFFGYTSKGIPRFPTGKCFRDYE